MDNRTIASIIVITISLIVIRYAFELAIAAISFSFCYFVPLILINILYLLVWVVRLDCLYRDIKLFIEDKKTMRLGVFDFIDRIFFIPGYKRKRNSLHHF
jgi:fatty acid desaturase